MRLLNKIRLKLIYNFFVILLIISGCSFHFNKKNKLIFSDEIWYIKTSEIPVGPNGNLFSEKGVFVDKNGTLHLKLEKDNYIWQSAEVYSEKTFGYGTYIFYLDGLIDELHPNVVLGLFLYSDDPKNYHNEIDIEFSKWGKNNNFAGQYVIQPNIIKKMDLNLNGSYSTHLFTLEKNKITFASYHGHKRDFSNEKNLISKEEFSYQYKSHNEKVRMNLWILNPDKIEETEVKISRFRFIPLKK